jgi:HAD superfamily hydrolase (TIGR01450 family)
MDAQQAFARYEELRHRFPDARFPTRVRDAGSLSEIAGEVDVFVFDAFGVLNVGKTPVRGAARRIAHLRALGKRLFVLTNSASGTLAQNIEKLCKLGFDFTADEVVSSRKAALAALPGFGAVRRWGVVAPPGHNTRDLPFSHRVMGDDPAGYTQVDGFLILSAADWNAARQDILVKALQKRPRPVVVANPDLVAPNERGLNLGPGYFGHWIADKTPAQVSFFGKPYGDVYRLVEAALPPDQPPGRVVMVGDTLHTDILGAAARGWKTALVTDHGLFAGLETGPFIAASGIVPDWRVGSI